MRKRQAQRAALLIALIGLILFGSFYLTQYIESNAAARDFLTTIGYPGAFLLAFLFGMSVIIPIPPGSIAPAFTAAGLYLPLVILMLTIGTTMADIIGYYIGSYSRPFVRSKFPKIFKKLIGLKDKPRVYLYLFIFFYASLMPIPNETLVIPLGVIGYKLQTFILPLFLANLLHHTLTATGLTLLFSLFA